MPSAGTRVRVVDNERLDIPDYQAIFSLIYGWTQAAEGMIAGVNEGCLSPPAVTYEEVGPVRQIRLGNATLYGAQNDATSSNLTAAFPVVYDPTDPNQLQSTLDLSSYANAGGAIWWTVDLVNSDLDNRRVWEAGYPDGRAVAMLTRQRQRVRFEATADFNTSPTPGTWFRMGAFWLPTSGAPTVLWLHAYDYGRQTDLSAFIATGAEAGTRVRIGQWMFSDGYNPASNVGRSFGIGRYAAQLGMVALSMLDSGWVYDPQTLEITSAGTVGFETPPTRGLYQLDADLTTAETDINELQTQVADLNGFRSIFGCTISSSNVVTQERPFTAILSSTYSSGDCTITFNSALPSGSRIDDTSFPLVTNRDNDTRISAYWDSQYVLKVKSRTSGGSGVNVDFYLVIVGAYV